MINIVFLILSFLLTFFMVGHVIVEIFFPKIPIRIKFPLYIILSLLASTYLVYLAALIFGLSRSTVEITLLPFVPLSIYLIFRSKSEIPGYIRNHTKAFVLSGLTTLIYFIALFPAILGPHDNYLVMSGPNWQDTALHISITQSLSQGNFPPLSPYYSGTALNYYYFADFHSAIIDLFYGKFFPRVFVYDNALLAGVLSICIYSLAYEFTRNKKTSLISAFMGSFFGSFIFIRFFSFLTTGKNIIGILADNSFSMDYDHLFGMANMADYYLQNRPMMIGIPVVVVIMMVVLFAYRKKDLKVVLVAGLTAAFLIKFQFFCVMAASLSLFVFSIPLLKVKNIKFILKSYFIFILPIIAFYLILGTRSVNGISFFDLVKQTFHFGPWDPTKSIIWHIEFLLLNLGLPLLITILSLVLGLRNRKKILSLLALIFVAIPYVMAFTIAEVDMLKFFYFGVILFSIIAPYYLETVIKRKYLFNLIIAAVVFTSVFSSFLELGNSFFNKNYGYSMSDYNAGLFIRDNTPQRSVFVTTTSIHSPPTDFGGRLRILSYINWPYSHGFNTGPDNVFVREKDIKNAFESGNMDELKVKYGAKYVYFGSEEKSEYPGSGVIFDSMNNLEKIYNQEGIAIYEIL